MPANCAKQVISKSSTAAAFNEVEHAGLKRGNVVERPKSDRGEGSCDETANTGNQSPARNCVSDRCHSNGDGKTGAGHKEHSFGGHAAPRANGLRRPANDCGETGRHVASRIPSLLGPVVWLFRQRAGQASLHLLTGFGSLEVTAAQRSVTPANRTKMVQCSRASARARRPNALESRTFHRHPGAPCGRRIVPFVDIASE